MISFKAEKQQVSRKAIHFRGKVAPRFKLVPRFYRAMPAEMEEFQPRFAETFSLGEKSTS